MHATSTTHGPSLDSESAMEMSLFESMPVASKPAADEAVSDDDADDDDARRGLLFSTGHKPADVGVWPQAKDIVVEVNFHV
jgi:hypothetical protein